MLIKFMFSRWDLFCKNKSRVYDFVITMKTFSYLLTKAPDIVLLLLVPITLSSGSMLNEKGFVICSDLSFTFIIKYNLRVHLTFIFRDESVPAPLPTLAD